MLSVGYKYYKTVISLDIEKNVNITLINACTGRMQGLIFCDLGLHSSPTAVMWYDGRVLNLGTGKQQTYIQFWCSNLFQTTNLYIETERNKNPF
jgi:hypothetical protein